MQKFGLIVPKKTSVRKSTLFDEEDQEPLPPPPVHRKAEKSKQEALVEDPAVFDYDGAFDEMKRIQQLRKEALRGGNSSQPKYVHELIKAANKRKIEKERVNERKAQKEREKEGDLYGDKETFVTAAFMERQAELKRLEEEEKKKEAMEQSALNNGNMTGFYRNILSQNDRFELIQPILNTDIPIQETEETNDTNIEELVKAGIVTVNDDNEVVDKRQLLVAGLNIPKKKQFAKQEEKKQEAKAKEMDKQQEMAKRKRAHEAKRAQQFVEEQHKLKLETERKKKEEALQELTSKMAKKVDEKTVSDAKARYLARKQQKQQESDSE